MLLHHLGEPPGPADHLEDQKVPQANVLLHWEPGTVGLAGRSGVHGQHPSVGGKHVQTDPNAVVLPRGQHVRGFGSLRLQPTGHRHREAPHHAQDEAPQHRQHLQGLPAHQHVLVHSRHPGRSACPGVELHRQHEEVLHRAATLPQDLHPLLHHRLQRHPHGHRRVVRADLCAGAHTQSQAGLPQGVQRPHQQELGEVAGFAQDGHHCAELLHRLLGPTFHPAAAGRGVRDRQLRHPLQGRVVPGTSRAELRHEPAHLHPHQQRDASRIHPHARLQLLQPTRWEIHPAHNWRRVQPQQVG